MRRLLVTISLLCAFYPCASFCWPVLRPGEKRVVAFVVANENGHASLRISPGPLSMRALSRLAHNGVEVAYLAELTPRGFAIISDITELAPVRFICYSSDYAAVRDHDLIRFVLDDSLAAKRVLGYLPSAGTNGVVALQVNSYDTAQALSNEALWNLPESRRLLGPSLPVEANVPPLLASQWSQDDPFNLLTPILQNQHTVTGCTATAQAQIMHYWRFPSAGHGSVSYYWERGAATLSHTFGAAYDWPHMLNSYNTGLETNTERNAVATLMRDVGFSLSMQYGLSGSSSSLSDVDDSLRDFFFYPNPIEVYRSSYPSAESWFAVFKNQVDKKWPSILAIYSPEGSGHAVVIDGYRTDLGNQIHVNMGWAGYQDNYYTLDSILQYTQTADQSAAINIYPPGHISFNVAANTTEVINTGRSEVLASVSLSVSAAGVTGTTLGGAARFKILFSQPAIQIDNSLASGIRLFSSPGFAAAASIASVQNVVVGGRCYGQIAVDVQPGIVVGPADFLRVEGVRGRIDTSLAQTPGTDIYAELQSVTDAQAYSFNPGAVRVARSLDGMRAAVNPDSLSLCYAGTGKPPGAAQSQAITISEGFARAFVDMDSGTIGPAGDRVDCGGNMLGAPTDSTQFLVFLQGIPTGVPGVSWPAASTVSASGAVLQLVSSVFDAPGGMAAAVYRFEAANQTGSSDITVDSFTIKPAISVASGNGGSITATVGLHQPAEAPFGCAAPAPAAIRPRFMQMFESDSSDDVGDDPPALLAQVSGCVVSSLIPPALSAPANGAIDQAPKITLRWTDTNGATAESGYRVRIKPSGGAYTSYEVGANTTSFILPLAHGNAYSWNVQATGNGTTTLDSAWANSGVDWSFATTAAPAFNATEDLVLTPLAPCRIVDSRVGMGQLTGFVPRLYDVDAGTFAGQGGTPGSCGIPSGIAQAVVLTLTVTGPAAAGWISAWSLGPWPGTSTLTFSAGTTIANTTIVPVAPGDGADFTLMSSTATHVVIDVAGYFAAPALTAPECMETASDLAPIPANTKVTLQATCPAGYTAASGGWNTDDPELSNVWITSRPLSSTIESGWVAEADNRSASAHNVRARVRCCRTPGR